MVKAVFPAEIERLWHLGFAIHWLRPKSKIPVEAGWTSGERQSIEQLNRTHKKGYNYGVRLGRASLIAGAYLAILDIDVKSDAPADRKDALAKLAELFPDVVQGPYLISGRGNGSRHYYVRTPEPIKGDEVKARSPKLVKVKMPSVTPSKREAEELSDAEVKDGIRLRPAWEISLLSEGRQAAIVGSIHPDTLDTYKWGKAVNGTGKDIPLLKPEALPKPVTDRTHLKGPPPAQIFRLQDVRVEDLPLTDDQREEIRRGLNVVDRSAKVFELCIVLAAANVDDEKILSVFTDRHYYLGECAFDHAKTGDRQRAARWIEKYCLRKAKSRVNDSPFDIEEIPEPTDAWVEKSKAASKSTAAARRAEKSPPKRVIPLGFKGDEDWEDDLELRFPGAGKPPIIKCTLANIRLVLENRAGRFDFVRFEEFTQKTLWTCKTPWGIRAGAERSSGNDDSIRIKLWFADEYGVEPTNIMIDEALQSIALENKYHVVKHYLDRLEWDHVERLAGALGTYLGARMPEPYLSDVSRKFFLACVKRIYEPGCKFDHVVVLEGLQGIGKSTFPNILAGDDWFMDGLPNMADKDAALNLNGTWICELGELAAIYKSGNESMKTFIARRTDKVRPPYGHRRVDYPRSTVFLGSTDKRDYLTDPAGNRRFWPVAVTQCDFAGLADARNQLWAEAVWRYNFASEPLYLQDDALHQARAIQESRRVEDEGDAMRESFRRWVAGEIKEGRDVSVLIFSELFEGLPWSVIRNSQMVSARAGQILREFGYEKYHTKKGNRWVATGVRPLHLNSVRFARKMNKMNPK